jgi:hypothetical protein
MRANSYSVISILLSDIKILAISLMPMYESYEKTKRPPKKIHLAVDILR